MLFHEGGTEHFIVPVAPEDDAASKGWKLKDVLQRIHGSDLISNIKKFRAVADPQVVHDLLRLESYDPVNNRRHSFGIMYGSGPQQTEREMFTNSAGSPEFERFLGLCGQRIKLKNWEGYAGGLNTKHDTSGQDSVFATLDNHEIMFHVSTLLPDVTSRDRMLGADICRIVFVDGKTPFNLNDFEKHSTAVLAVVQPDDDPNLYRLAVACEAGTALVGPPVYDKYPRDSTFIDLLLTKLINLERAIVLNKSSWLQIYGKARLGEKQLLEEYYTHYYNKKASETALGSVLVCPALNPSQCTMLIPTIEYKPVVRGEAMVEGLAGPVLSVSVWDEDAYFYGTEEGLFLHDRVSGYRDRIQCPQYERQPVTQMAIVREEGVLVVLSGSPSQISLLDYTLIGRDRPHRPRVVPNTQRAHLFTVQTVEAYGTFMCVAINGEVTVFKWDDFDHTFVELKKVKVPSKPLVMRLSDTAMLCVAARQTFLLIDLVSDAQTQLWSSKDETMEPLDAFCLSNDYFGPTDPKMTRWLLCYKKCAVLVEVLMPDGGRTVVRESYVARWVSAPQHMGVLGPYVLGLSATMLEVRSLLNGTILDSLRALAPHVSGASSPFEADNAPGWGGVYLPTWNRMANAGGLERFVIPQ